MPFCTHCGLEYGQPANFCNRCGRALPVAAARESAVAAATPLELPYYISMNRIIFMTVLSFGLYLYTGSTSLGSSIGTIPAAKPTRFGTP